jgi:hypothetical protein
VNLNRIQDIPYKGVLATEFGVLAHEIATCPDAILGPLISMMNTTLGEILAVMKEFWFWFFSLFFFCSRSISFVLFFEKRFCGILTF